MQLSFFAKRAGSFGTALEKTGLAVHEIVADAAGGITVILIKYIRQSQDKRNGKPRPETSL